MLRQLAGAIGAAALANSKNYAGGPGEAASVPSSQRTGGNEFFPAEMRVRAEVMLRILKLIGLIWLGVLVTAIVVILVPYVSDLAARAMRRLARWR